MADNTPLYYCYLQCVQHMIFILLQQGSNPTNHCCKSVISLRVNIKFYNTNASSFSSTLQIYERFVVDSIIDADNARFEYFVKKVCLKQFFFVNLVIEMKHKNVTYATHTSQDTYVIIKFQATLIFISTFGTF